MHIGRMDTSAWRGIRRRRSRCPQPETGNRRQTDFATALVRAVDARDAYTRGHSETVSSLCTLVARQLGLDSERIAKLRIAGLLHDVGKVGTPDAILNKPGGLTDAEYEVIKEHSVRGSEIARAANLEQESRWIRHHHERIDGRGYPDGLADGQIPPESRIILVADSFEAITSDRPYRKGRSQRKALEELERCAGSQFAPDCVQALRDALTVEPGKILYLPPEAPAGAIGLAGAA